MKVPMLVKLQEESKRSYKPKSMERTNLHISTLKTTLRMKITCLVEKAVMKTMMTKRRTGKGTLIIHTLNPS